MEKIRVGLLHNSCVWFQFPKDLRSSAYTNGIRVRKISTRSSFILPFSLINFSLSLSCIIDWKRDIELRFRNTVARNMTSSNSYNFLFITGGGGGRGGGRGRGKRKFILVQMIPLLNCEKHFRRRRTWWCWRRLQRRQNSCNRATSS